MKTAIFAALAIFAATTTTAQADVSVSVGWQVSASETKVVRQETPSVSVRSAPEVVSLTARSADVPADAPTYRTTTTNSAYASVSCRFVNSPVSVRADVWSGGAALMGQYNVGGVFVAGGINAKAKPTGMVGYSAPIGTNMSAEVAIATGRASNDLTAMMAVRVSF